MIEVVPKNVLAQVEKKIEKILEDILTANMMVLEWVDV